MNRILKTLLLVLSLGFALVMLSPVQTGAAAPIAEADTDAFLNANFSLQNTYSRVQCVSNSGSCPAQITTTVPCLTSPCTKPSTLYSIHSTYTTIQAASNAAIPGTLIIIMPGTYRGVEVEGGGGANNAYIHFRGWGQPGSVIVNQDSHNAGYLKDNFYFVDTHHYIIQNIAFTNAERAGIFLTGYFSGTGHFSDHFIVMDVYSHDNYKWGLHTTSTNHVVIQDSFFTGSEDEHGAYISGSGDHMVIRRSVFQNNNASGLQINADPQTAAIEIFYFLDGTTGNTCGITEAQIDWDGPATWQQIHNCYVSQSLPNLGDKYEDGISKNIIVEQNVMHGNGSAGGAAINLASLRDSSIRNNLVYGNGAGGIACWDNAYVDDKGVTTFGCNNVTIVNNTLVDNVGTRGSMILMNYATNMDIVNNIIVRPRSDAYEITNHSASGLFSGDNYYYALERSADSTGWTQLDTSPGSGSITGFSVANALTQFAYASFQPWILQTGAWPVLNDCRPDYRPLPGSVLASSGSDPYSPSADRDGEARSGLEMGAYRAAPGPRGECITTSIFADVPTAGKEWMQPYIEQFYSLGITAGCNVSPLRYCPEDPVNRGAMAVFLLRAMNYPDLPHTPANTTPNPFADVPAVGKEWMEPWIEEFYSLGITGGCNVSPLRYCPESSVTRAAMAVFILRAIEGPSYVPTPGGSYFTDVPVAGKEWMEPWVDELYERGITGGCGVSPMRFCPEDPVTRGAMAVFILRAFENLPQP